MSARNRVPLMAFLALIALLVGVSLALYLQKPTLPPIQSGTLLPQPRPLPDFTLAGADGHPYTRADLLGHWTIVYAGYTHCPDVCPTTLAQLKATMTALGDQAARVSVLFISVDPARDTPDTLASYVRAFDPGFRAATGSPSNLERIGRAMGFVFEKVPGSTPGSYTMDHSAALILIDPKAEIAGYLVPPFKPEVLAADIKSILDHS